MTTGPEHYREAERLAALAAEYWQQPGDGGPTTDPDELTIIQHIREQARADTAAEQADALLADLAPILDEVAVERARQYATYGPQPIPLGTGRPGAGVAAARVREEAIQVAAVAIQIVQRCDQLLTGASDQP
jgi:hypothetical protein